MADKTAIQELIEAMEARNKQEANGPDAIKDRAAIVVLLHDPALLAELKQAKKDAELRGMVETRYRKELSPGQGGGWWARILVGFDSGTAAGKTLDEALEAALKAAGVEAKP